MLPSTTTETHVLISICTPKNAYPRFHDAILSTKYFDDESELAYFGYRYYSPELGRWVSRDPIGELGLRLSLLSNNWHQKAMAASGRSEVGARYLEQDMQYYSRDMLRQLEVPLRSYSVLTVFETMAVHAAVWGEPLEDGSDKFSSVTSPAATSSPKRIPPSHLVAVVAIGNEYSYVLNSATFLVDPLGLGARPPSFPWPWPGISPPSNPSEAFADAVREWVFICCQAPAARDTLSLELDCILICNDLFGFGGGASVAACKDRCIECKSPVPAPPKKKKRWWWPFSSGLTADVEGLWL